MLWEEAHPYQHFSYNADLTFSPISLTACNYLEAIHLVLLSRPPRPKKCFAASSFFLPPVSASLGDHLRYEQNHSTLLGVVFRRGWHTLRGGQKSSFLSFQTVDFERGKKGEFVAHFFPGLQGAILEARTNRLENILLTRKKCWG